MTEEPTPNAESTPPVEPAVPDPPRPRSFYTKSPNKNNPYTWGTGRRKSSVARVRIRPGDGKYVINKREISDYFCLEKDRIAVRVPLEVTETSKTMDVFVNVCGGGVTGQAGAVLLGLARALARHDETFLPKLHEKNLMSRDPRKVERKKYGQRGARRRFQFSKR